MDRDGTVQWLEAFKREHGYYPNEDKDLLGKGMSPEEAMQEHMRAKSWGEDFAQATGRSPTYDDYRSEQPRRYSRTGELVSGFGGYSPEKVESLRNNPPSSPSASEPALPESRPMPRVGLMRRPPTMQRRQGF